MEHINHYVIARAIHVVGVVLWIGGVAFVTTVLIPALKKLNGTEKRLELFEQLEGKFSFQAKIVTLVTGLSGFWMLEVMHGWNRYLHLQFWWLHLMTLIWFIFTIILFVLEPLFLHRCFHKFANENGDRAFVLLHRAHKILLGLSLIAIIGAVVGVH